ncbi:MAG: L,D-transpeptidase family protein [Ignavibacteria bacterium]|nr:L,D-transpeptidase family protein [Ignavibacteria bacterium]
MKNYFKFWSINEKMFLNASRKFRFLSIIVLILLGCGCKSKQDRTGFDVKYKFSSTEFQQFFQNRFNPEDFSFRTSVSRLEYFDTLKYFYLGRDFQPMFMKSFDDKYFADSMLTVIKAIEKHGLSPNRYNYDLIKNEYENIYDSTNANNSVRYIHMANVELLLADAVLKYSYHLRFGVVNPVKLFPDSYFIPVVDSTKREIFEPLRKENVLQYLKEIQPKSLRYKKLQAALPFFTNLENLPWKKISPLDKKLKIGERTIQLKPVIERLALLGFVDTSKIVQKSFDLFDSTTAKALAKFQKANGLIDDGTIGKATIEKLNRSPKEYVEKIKISLERFRWTNYTDSSRYLAVNIPDFFLRVMENKQEKFNIKICTGRKRPANYEARLKVYEKTKNWRNKPDDWETPQLYGRVTYLILNPTWTVPTSIIREEIYRKSTQDSLYLRKQNFKVLYMGKEMDLDEVNLRKFSPNRVPYIFVQDPGAGNALGRIKFMFSNKFDIYLHDTPTRAPFSAANRAVSHGCVRVEKPLLLADYVLKNNSKWEPDYVRIEVGLPAVDKTKVSEFREKRAELRNFSFGKTTQVNLDKSISLFIDYFTAWVGEDGTPNFRDDVYGKDEVLKTYLFPSN